MTWVAGVPGDRREKGVACKLLCIVGAFAFALAGASCGENYSYTSRCESLADGQDGRASAAFSMNRRPVKLELYVRVDEGSAVVELDHPDGRTTEFLEIKGPAIRNVRKEFAKEPGSWGLLVTAKGGTVSYWAALHDRKKYQGPDYKARRLVEGK